MPILLNNSNLVWFVALAVIAIFIGIGVLLLGLFRINKSRDVVSHRLQNFVETGEKSATDNSIPRILPRELSGSLYSRILKPLFQNIINYFGRFTPAGSIAKTDHTLTEAGNPYGMRAQQFYGLRVLFLLVGIFLAFLYNYYRRPADIWSILLGLLLILLTLLLPRIWLDSLVRSRKDELRRNLPDALDMLSVCATAGLGFDQSLRKICEYWPTTLSSEFKHVLQEMDMGVSRAEALRNMSGKIEVEEFSSFIAIIIQAETIGMSFSEVLHSQAVQMRLLRQFRAKEIANSLPAKMIIPVAIFIFPALIAVILGPVVPVLLNMLS